MRPEASEGELLQNAQLQQRVIDALADGMPHSENLAFDSQLATAVITDMLLHGVVPAESSLRRTLHHVLEGASWEVITDALAILDLAHPVPPWMLLASKEDTVSGANWIEHAREVPLRNALGVSAAVMHSALEMGDGALAWSAYESAMRSPFHVPSDVFSAMLEHLLAHTHGSTLHALRAARVLDEWHTRGVQLPSNSELSGAVAKLMRDARDRKAVEAAARQMERMYLRGCFFHKNMVLRMQRLCKRHRVQMNVPERAAKARDTAAGEGGGSGGGDNLAPLMELPNTLEEIDAGTHGCTDRTAQIRHLLQRDVPDTKP
eukprot:TRINITY_DN1000_c0_g1_i3.p1 TRINITY_DN1000_c0_g1~~TRINITY_DN1000_c0_g1_i3.p1  ORF type:complete len:328 (-),score=127.52 TRINITY_DN1000_c0_g1_i3:657-1613(-)